MKGLIKIPLSFERNTLRQCFFLTKQMVFCLSLFSLRLPAFALCENNVTSEIVKSHELEIRTLANLSSLEVNKPHLWFLSYGFVFLFLSFYGALV